MDYEDSDYDDWDDDYGDDDDDEVDTVPCPECGTDVYEESSTCPNCGCYIHEGYAGGSYYPWYTFGGALRDWSPFWLFLAMGGVIITIFMLMV
ncbi:hypothetical protein [uncultured Rubinisphaera sp.]|uniref:hypothetical protein n=1 Tax=uncultured Rubinisphaera sp. TaxID=1678686 RepID=UPI0030D88F83|tara:strand:- start:54 stop:332 length:279 start_codon:yes stop_codon:yes gene_type:complete